MKIHDAGKRYRAVANTRARLGQVMTPQPLADAVVSLMGARGGRWLELGSGSGRLAEAVNTGASPASYLGIEIEPDMVALSPAFPGFSFVQQDVLAVDGLAQVLQVPQFDHVIGNPPYGIHGFSAEATSRLQKLCPELEVQGNWAPIDLYFVLESLSRLKPSGSAAFIVGADIPCGIQSQRFREMLLEKASDVECYELPTTAFGGYTEVQAYALIARYGKSRARHVSLGRLNEQFEVTARRRVSRAQAIVSMDLGSHEFAEIDAALRQSSHGMTMKDMEVSIVRGSRTRSQFSQLGVAHFHTSDFPRSGMEVSFETASSPDFQQATVGDILLPRVGTRCLEHKAVVVSGQAPYSDAVFRVRMPAKHQERVVRWITSSECSAWRRGAARGACAKHLTVSTLLSMPVPH
ncbi:Methyltransferase domain-containing protein [Pseudomonas sp. NFACC02]|uniref:N-6 DNA methylase n=1 Tax=Pseudomonas sp. NFACC02 TaxID=1566250 RepID=UPI0008BDFCDE|nr:N-6 DNA methylase [Pseudomonas sp. NFACC02]SEQ55122.1 Methyltransferase domain-containing protein [Pseudomonas sp. NFACC02]